ncbi:MAE_28990/MAE_18760 family HEPN-like nuclease [Chitinophaga niabensis]|nr:MAE_28990/MAE_18760 family HEPN-like nuclease [Chitinophaga niabensis]
MTRLKFIDGALNLPTLIDNGVAPSEHNGIANLLRKGLGIVSFNILEDYIKKKVAEALTEISSSGIVFGDLTDEMQNSSIFGALEALRFRADMVKKNESLADAILMIQTESSKISSTSNNPFILSDFSFVSSNSNINVAEITEMIKAFGIGGGWVILKKISDLIGGGIPDLGQAYKNAFNRRNRAAHGANFIYEYQALESFKNEIIAIAASMDIVLTARCRQVRKRPREKVSSHDIRTALNYRFLEPRGSIFIESKVIGGKVVKKWPTKQDGINYIQPRLMTKNEFLIILNGRRRIVDWYVQ